MYYTCPHVEYKQWLSSFPPNFVSFKWHLKNSLVIPGVPLDQHSGEKGITISGGQRARIAMARAFYANPASRTAANAWWRPTGPWCTKWRSISKWEKTSACVIYICIYTYIYIYKYEICKLWPFFWTHRYTDMTWWWMCVITRILKLVSHESGSVASSVLQRGGSGNVRCNTLYHLVFHIPKQSNLSGEQSMQLGVHTAKPLRLRTWLWWMIPCPLWMPMWGPRFFRIASWHCEAVARRCWWPPISFSFVLLRMRSSSWSKERWLTGEPLRKFLGQIFLLVRCRCKPWSVCDVKSL